MPAKTVYEYCKEPIISVIIPSLDGDRQGNVSRLVESLREQTFKEIEIIISIGERPNGHARNVGFNICSNSSQFLVFFDDDVIIDDKRILEKFVVALGIPEYGLVGAAQLPPPGSNRLQKWLAYDLGKASISVQTTYLETEMVTHAGMACRREVWLEQAGEDSKLITGTDTDLRERLRNFGYKVVLVPDTLVYHPLPDRLYSVFASAYRHGWYQYDYRKKHGFQRGFLAMFPNVRSKIICALIIIRELMIIIPHTFIANRENSLGFRPINAVFRIIMEYGYLKRCLTQNKN